MFKVGDRVVGMVDVSSPESGPEAPVEMSGVVTRIEGRKIWWRIDALDYETWNGPALLKRDEYIREGGAL